MRTLICVVLLLVLAGGMAWAELPKSLDELKARIPTEAKTPEGGLKLWFDCVFAYLGGDQTLGAQLITEMTKDKDWQSTMNYFVDSLNNKPYIWRSYVKGATPENKYQMDPNKYELSLQDVVLKPFDDYEEGKVVKISVCSSGADTPRPFFLERNSRGEYKAREFSSLCVGVRPPVEPIIAAGDIPQSTDPLWVWKELLHGVLLYLAGQEAPGKQIMTALLQDGDMSLITRYAPLSTEKAYIWRSYVKGTKVEDGYQVDPANFQPDAYLRAPLAAGAKRCTVWVKSTGGVTDRPCIMVADDRGQWRVSELSSLCVGLQKVPKPPDADNF